MSSSKNTSLRLLPGIIIVIIQIIIRFVLPVIYPKAMVMAFFGGILGGLAIAIWWLFFSRAARLERWGAVLLMIVTLYLTSLFLDVSIATANMGLMFILFSIPPMSLLFVIWAVATRNMSDTPRRIIMVVTILIASGGWLLLRTNGMDGDGHQDLGWRWAKTSEDRLLEQAGQKPAPPVVSIEDLDFNADWPGFRGLNRDGIVRGIGIDTNWSANPPAEIWRRPVGPGCSSFAAHGSLLYTQEQLGEFEVVSCYNLADGNIIWQHQDKTRFYDSHAGPGPRSTPVLSGSRIYSLGATGILNSLDASDGSVYWSRNAAADTKAKLLDWGFTASPLTYNDQLIVAVSGRLAAYDTLNGNLLWLGPDGGGSYSSPQLVSINGIPQIVFMSDSGAVSVDPANGQKLWDYPWEIDGRILQPSLIESGDFLLSGENKGVRRISVVKSAQNWELKDLWDSPGIIVNFNDFVLHKGFAYGFDGPSMVCIDLKTGLRVWRGARYRGWLLLLQDQDLIVVLSEKGDLALVKASPARFTELSFVPGIKGKTWNHPIIVGNILLARNAQEMAAFLLPLSQ